MYATPTIATLDRLARSSAEQHTTVTIGKTYDLDEALQTFADLGAGTKGKLVLPIV